MSKKPAILALCCLVFFLSAGVKILIGTGYHSTDFEVHRNWLAITHSLPLSQWYFEDTSIWTLDYPPFFAYFEWLLSQVAAQVDPGMLVVSNLGYDSFLCIAFQRGSVIVADLVLLFGVYKFLSAMVSKKSNTTSNNALEEDIEDAKIFAIVLTTLLNAGLFLVDHIHFQYNGMLLGILLLSLAAIRAERHLEAALWFAILLQFKHIFLYVAPVYGIYLLRVAVLNPGRWWDISRLQWKNVVALFVILAVTFGLSLGPFIALGQIPQLLARLFPFKRGLVHAYWAPNAWALYMGFDLFLARSLGIRSSIPNSTSGLVGSTATLVLPNIPPPVTLALTVLFMAPLLWKVWNRPTPRTFLFAYVPISLCSFLFGWHVHEKAILITLVPFGLVAFESPAWAQQFLRLSLAGHFGLVPLFLEETPSYYVVYFIILLHWFVSMRASDRIFTFKNKKVAQASDPQKDDAGPTRIEAPKARFEVMGAVDIMLLVGMAGLAVVNGVILPSVLPKFEFLPLLFTSIFAATFVVKVFIDTTRMVMAL